MVSGRWVTQAGMVSGRWVIQAGMVSGRWVIQAGMVSGRWVIQALSGPPMLLAPHWYRQVGHASAAIRDQIHQTTALLLPCVCVCVCVCTSVLSFSPGMWNLPFPSQPSSCLLPCTLFKMQLLFEMQVLFVFVCVCVCVCLCLFVSVWKCVQFFFSSRRSKIITGWQRSLCFEVNWGEIGPDAPASQFILNCCQFHTFLWCQPNRMQYALIFMHFKEEPRARAWYQAHAPATSMIQHNNAMVVCLSWPLQLQWLKNVLKS